MGMRTYGIIEKSKMNAAPRLAGKRLSTVRLLLVGGARKDSRRQDFESQTSGYHSIPDFERFIKAVLSAKYFTTS